MRVNNGLQELVIYKRSLIVLLLFILQACSLMNTAYNKAPSLTYWWLDSYLDFSAEQKPGVKDELAALHAWHRKNELPVYADFVHELKVSATQDIEPATVCKAFSDVRSRMRASREHILPVTMKATVALSDDQLAYLEKQFAKRNKKWREEWMEGTPQERKEHRVEEAVKNAEKFYGKLENAQVDIIKRNMEESSFDPQVVYKEIVRRETDTLKTLKGLQSSTSLTEVRAELEALLARYIDSPDPAYVRYFDSFSKESCQSVARLHNATTAAQRAKAVETLAEYESNFRKLSQQQ